MSVKTKSLFSFEDLKDFSLGRIRTQFGGKALGLYEAYLLNLPLPKTWLFPIEYYEEFLKKEPERQTFQKEAKEWLKERFKKEMNELPDTLYAVRSSSQYEDASLQSFAGIFESKLDVKKGDIVDAIAEVWDSCFSLRAASYSKEKHDLHMGILIQPMIKPKFSGVAFSKHPSPFNVQENQNLVIEFAPHSGEKIVQGEVTPFRLSGTVDSILSATDALWVGRLLQVLFELKQKVRHEVDIEFVVDEREDFWLLQQRPVSVMHASHILDLTNYQRKYKRSLNCLDTELLIEGCSLFLPSYLEIPYQMEKWMVMTTGKDQIQELWIHEILDNAVTTKICGRILEDSHYLERIENRYRRFFHSIFEFDYQSLLESSYPLENRFFAFCEFILPLEAHYYVPMFVIEALNRLLKEECEKIDSKNAFSELFKMGTFEISSLFEVLSDELRNIKNHYSKLPQEFHQLREEDQRLLQNLTERYGFLKCRSLEEKGYTVEELFSALKQVQEKKKKSRDEYETLKKKYLRTEKTTHLFEKFREWMRIRNQEMEFLMYALLKCRPLFDEITSTLSCSLNKFWNTSKETISYCLRSGDLAFLANFSTENLVIYRSYGKTRLTTELKILKPEEIAKKSLRGKTVFGSNSLQGKVKIAFSIKELKNFNASENTILVTGMTTPDFIPYLKDHFVALITDEGGILCHAAIVAREIPIPCLVGTGVASEVLKDGQTVTIDFDRGEVHF